MATVGCGRHAMPSPACNYGYCTQLHRPLQLAMAVDNSLTNLLPSLKFVGDTLSVSALIDLVILIFDFWP